MTRRISLTLGFVALWVYGLACAKGYEELGPFPCGQDRTCPYGLACHDGKVCQSPEVDDLCSSDSDCCPTYGCYTRVCILGVCAEPCTAGKCPQGRACLDNLPYKTDICYALAECTGDSCLDGAECAPTWVGGQKACVGRGQGQHLKACRTYSVIASCEATPVYHCGPGMGTVPCGSGTCPEYSVCVDGDRCRCVSGFTAADCSGRACGSDCSPPNYGCHADGPNNPGCDTSPVLVRGTCVCTDGRDIDTSCGDTTPCEELCKG